MKFKHAVSKILTSKTTLHIISALSLLNIIGYLVLGNINNVLYFIVIAGLTLYFSKNMIIVLGIPLVIVNLIHLKKSREGMENKKQPQPETKPTQPTKQPPKKNNLEAKTKQGLPMHPVSETETEEQSGVEMTNGKVRGGGTHKIDYATTVEEAYDNLNSILGGEGIQKLTKDSKQLMQQQLQLAEAMKGMGPVLQSIAPMVENLKGMMGDGNGGGGLENIMNMANKLNVSK
jgi:hypothetical protein